MLNLTKFASFINFSCPYHPVEACSGTAVYITFAHDNIIPWCSCLRLQVCYGTTLCNKASRSDREMFHHKMQQNKRPGRNPGIVVVAKILLVGADSNST